MAFSPTGGRLTRTTGGYIARASRTPLPIAGDDGVLCPDSGKICYRAACLVFRECEDVAAREDGHDEDEMRADHIGRMCTWTGINCYLSECNRNNACKYFAQNTGATALPAAGASNVVDTSGVGSGSCHYGLYHLGDLGKASVWVGREAAASVDVHGSNRQTQLVVSLIGEGNFGSNWDRISREISGNTEIVTGNDTAQKRLPAKLFAAEKREPTAFMQVDWPDYGTPGLNRQWWVDFAEALSELDGNVVIYCVGGHGRTGTAGAILAVLAGWCGRHRDPVQWVRDKYCKSVVESEEQIKYVEAMTGAKVHAGPSKSSYTTYSSSAPTASIASIVPARRNLGDPKPNATAPDLTAERYKKWAERKLRRAKSKGVRPKRLGDLVPGEVIAYDGWHYRWLKGLGEFRPTDAPVGPPSAALQQRFDDTVRDYEAAKAAYDSYLSGGGSNVSPKGMELGKEMDRLQSRLGVMQRMGLNHDGNDNTSRAPVADSTTTGDAGAAGGSN